MSIVTSVVSVFYINWICWTVNNADILRERQVKKKDSPAL